MKFSIFLNWILGLLSLLVVIGIVLANYSAAIYLAIGLGAFTVIALMVRFLGPKKALWVGIPVLVVIICLTSPFFLLSNSQPINTPCKEGNTTSTMELTGYLAEIEPENFSNGSFRVTEHVTYKEMENTCVAGGWQSEIVHENLEQDLPGRMIQSDKKGLFMHEVFIPVKLDEYECCPDDVSAVIKSIPYNSFYDAQYAENFKTDEYLGNETITWKTSLLQDGLRFAYISSPFYNLRVLLTPFIELSKYDNIVLAVFGFLISSIFMLIIKPNVIGLINDRVKKIFKKDDGADHPIPPKRKAKRNQ